MQFKVKNTYQTSKHVIANKVKTLRLGYPDTYNEAPPRNLTKRVMELRPNHEAPPRHLRGITSWLWGTTTKPSWNYVLTMRHHHETFVELHSGCEAPPWALTKRVRELRPYMRYHYELSLRGSGNYVLT